MNSLTLFFTFLVGLTLSIRRIQVGPARVGSSRDDPPRSPRNTDYNKKLSTRERMRRTEMTELDVKNGIEYKYKWTLKEYKALLENAPESQTFGDIKTEGDEYPFTDEDLRRLHVLGTDGRWENTASPPNTLIARYVGFISVSQSGGGFKRCTGVLIRDKWALTAGHCLYSRDSESWYLGWKFYPRKTSTYSSSPIDADFSYVLDGWTLFGDDRYDIGLLRLENSPGLGSVTWGYSNNIQTGTAFCMYGFQKDKNIGSLWVTSDAINRVEDLWLGTDDTDDDTTDYSIQNGYSSGGPAYTSLVEGIWKVYGVHVGSLSPPEGPGHIEARLTADRVGILNNIMDNNP